MLLASTSSAATKRAAEDMAHSYAHLFGLPVTMFRFFTVYGPGRGGAGTPGGRGSGGGRRAAAHAEICSMPRSPTSLSHFWNLLM